VIATAVALGLRRVGRPARLDTALTVSHTRPPKLTFWRVAEPLQPDLLERPAATPSISWALTRWSSRSRRRVSRDGFISIFRARSRARSSRQPGDQPRPRRRHMDKSVPHRSLIRGARALLGSRQRPAPDVRDASDRRSTGSRHANGSSALSTTKSSAGTAACTAGHLSAACFSNQDGGASRCGR
jgi:hypothetical protein